MISQQPRSIIFLPNPHSRIAWRGRDSNYDCTIRVSNLELRDAGKWVCEIGSSTKENFQVQTKEFLIDIESELVVHEIRRLSLLFIHQKTHPEYV